MEIVNKRIDAKPRSKYIRNSYVSSYYSGGNGGNGTSIDTSNFVWLNGRTSQLISGNVGATGDIIAYQTSEHDITLPIASTDALGTIKVGSGLTITEEGVLSVTGSTGGGTSGGNGVWGQITGTLSDQTDLWNELSKKANTADLNIENWDIASDFIVENKEEIEGAITNSHSHDNKEYLDVIDQNLSTVSDVLFNNVHATGDVVAYATGNHDISYPIASEGALGCIMVGDGLQINEEGPIASEGALGCIMVGDGLQINEEGVLSVTGGSGGSGKAEWGYITGTLSAQTDLWNELNKKANTSDLNISNWNNAYNNMHTHSNKSVLDGISSSDISDWNSAYSQRHTHSNMTYLNNINQYLSTSSSPNFSNIYIGSNWQLNYSGGDLNLKYNGSIAGYLSGSNRGNLLMKKNIIAEGDVIAYSTGTANAPFKYWRPSVSSSGVISWTNSTSETVPTSVNIKGPAGTLTYQWSGTSLRIGTTKNGSTTWGSYVNLKGADGKDGSSFNGGTITNNLTVSRNGGVAILGLYGNHTTWQAAQIQLVNNGFSDYRHKWTIDLAGSSEQNGDLCFQNYNSQDTGSPNASPWYRLKIYKHGTATNAVAAGGAYVNASDERLKNVLYSYHNKPQTISEDGTTISSSVLGKLKNLESKYFYWKVPENADADEKELPFYNALQLGFIAQEVEAQFPEFVSEDNGYKQLNYAGLGSFIAVEGCRELNEKIEQQQAELQIKDEIRRQ